MSAAAESQVSRRDLCNLLTEHPFDKNKETEGVDFGDLYYFDYKRRYIILRDHFEELRPLRLEAALVACRQAVELKPTDPKLQFQLGRLLHFLNASYEQLALYHEALLWYRRAAAQGHASRWRAFQPH